LWGKKVEKRESKRKWSFDGGKEIGDGHGDQLGEVFHERENLF
jgi:hypothetical protein